MLSGSLFAIGCGKSPAGPDAPGGAQDCCVSDMAPIDVPGHNPGTPGLGVHGIKFYHLADPNPGSTTSISTLPMTTQASGSTIVVSVGRGDKTLFAAPTDNKGNGAYPQVGQMHPYEPPYNESGTALYAFTGARGGAGFQVTTSTGNNSKGQLDEVTIAAVEVIEGIRIQDQQWNVVVQQNTPVPVTSKNVTTTGPATLIAFWWGDGFPDTTSQTATPNNGFVVVDTNVEQLHSFVQCAVAVKNVSAAGTYNVTWMATPLQGAQLWLVAVQ